MPNTLFLGYCNGHNLYFPTIEAVSEGGYGADPPVSPVQIGAGEQWMNQALMNLYTMLGKFPEPKPKPGRAKSPRTGVCLRRHPSPGPRILPATLAYFSPRMVPSWRAPALRPNRTRPA